MTIRLRRKFKLLHRRIGAAGRVAMCAALPVIVLAITPGVAAAEPVLEATLSAEIDKSGKAHAELTLINHSRRNICFFSEFEAFMRRNDGSILGQPVIVDYLMPDTMNVVWSGGFPQHFQIPFNPPELSPDEMAQAAKATATFEAYDCIELLAARGREPKKPLYKMNLSAAPTKG